MSRADAAAAAADTLAYLRVSKEEQAAPGKTSLEDQRAAVQQLAGQLGRALPAAAVFVDPGVSGGSAERPGFQELVAFCEQHPRRPATGLVLVLNDSRWGRFPNAEEAAYWRVRLDRAGWRVRYVEGNTDDQSLNPIMRALHGTQATQYREALRRNSRRGARGAAGRGLWQNEAPVGYRRSAARPGQPGRVLEPGQRKAPDEETRLVPGPADEQAMVRYAFKVYAEGQTSLAGLVVQLRIRWPRKRWSTSTLGAMLKNPAYVGDVVWCRTRKEEGYRQDRQPREEWVITRDAHQALVSRATFAMVEATFARNRDLTRAADGEYPLSGLIHCAVCGAHYIGGGGARGPAEDPLRYRQYLDAGGNCSRGQALLPCPRPIGRFLKRVVEPLVIKAIADVVSMPAVQTRIAAALDRRLEADRAAAGPRRRDLDQERQRLEGERDRLVAAVGRGLLLDREAAGQLAAIRTQLEATAAAIERQRFDGRRLQVLRTERERILALAADFAAAARQASGRQLRTLLEPWIASAVYDKRNSTLRLQIRQVPAVAPFLDSSTSPELSGQVEKVPVIRRTLHVPRRGEIRAA